MKLLLGLIFVLSMSGNLFAIDDYRIEILSLGELSIKHTIVGRNPFHGVAGEKITRVQFSSKEKKYEINFPFGTPEKLVKDYMLNRKAFIVDGSVLEMKIDNFYEWDYRDRPEDWPRDAYSLTDEQRETVNSYYLKNVDVTYVLKAQPAGAVMGFIRDLRLKSKIILQLSTTIAFRLF